MNIIDIEINEVNKVYGDSRGFLWKHGETHSLKNLSVIHTFVQDNQSKSTLIRLGGQLLRSFNVF